MEHPTFEGRVVNRVRSIPEGFGVELEFDMDWRARPGAPEPPEDPCGMIRSALEHTREIAEELHRATVE